MISFDFSWTWASDRGYFIRRKYYNTYEAPSRAFQNQMASRYGEFRYIFHHLLELILAINGRSWIKYATLCLMRLLTSSLCFRMLKTVIDSLFIHGHSFMDIYSHKPKAALEVFHCFWEASFVLNLFQSYGNIPTICYVAWSDC